MEATGHVRIVQGDREAVCGRAEVDPREDKIVLTGDPVVTDRGNGTTWTGDTITMLRSQRRVLVGHPRVTGPPIKDLGFDKNQPPPPAGTPPAAPRQEDDQRHPDRGPGQDLRRSRRRRRRQPPLRGGRGRRAARPQRRRQDDDLLHDRRPDPGHRRAACGSTAATSPRLRMHERARHGIGYLPQEPSVFRKLTVAQNILAIVEAVGTPALRARRQGRATTSRSSTWPTSPTRRPTPSPAASAGAWKSRARWSPGPSSC